MESVEELVPFGILFEESAQPQQDSIAPVYDEETDLSYVEDSLGHRIPYVEAVSIMSTNTATKEKSEATDPDEYSQASITSTRTFTEVGGEPTDADEDSCFRQGGIKISTNTATFVADESDDSDAEDGAYEVSLQQSFLSGTDTFTKIKKESVD